MSNSQNVRNFVSLSVFLWVYFYIRTNDHYIYYDHRVAELLNNCNPKKNGLVTAKSILPPTQKGVADCLSVHPAILKSNLYCFYSDVLQGEVFEKQNKKKFFFLSFLNCKGSILRECILSTPLTSK